MNGRFVSTRGWSGVDEIPQDELDGVFHFVGTSAFVVGLPPVLVASSLSERMAFATATSVDIPVRWRR